MTARLYLTVYARDDMNGASLGTVDAWTELEFTDALHGTGSGRVRINRYHPQADLLVQDRYVRVHSDAGVVGAFFLEQGTVDLSASEGTGDEWLEWIGRGPLAILESAVMDNDSDIFQGHDPIDGFWELANQGPLAGDESANPITMFKRAIVEAKLQTPTGLGGVTHASFDYDTDSNGDPLPFIDGEWGVNVGDDLLTVLRKLDQIGGVTFRMSTDFELSAWLTYGTDRSGAFGAGNVRFEKNVNIATAIDRKVRGGVTRTHLIVGGADRVFVTVTDPDYTTGDVIRWGFLSVPETSNESALEAAGLAHIEARKRQTDVWVIPAHDHGDDEAAGIYEPGTHYFVGDTVTVHTGTGSYDANEVADVVASVTWKGKTGDEANEDYWVIVEIGSTFSWEANTGFDSNPGSQHAFSLCQALTPGTETVLRRYYSSDTETITPLTADAAWADGGSVPVRKVTSAPDDTYSGGGTGDIFAGVNVGVSNRLWDDDLYALKITDAGLLAGIQAGGVQFTSQIPARSRSGIGISEASQYDIAQVVIRVYRAGTGFIGTALAAHANSTGTKFVAVNSSTWQNRTLSGTTAAVATAATNDWLIIEPGCRHIAPTSGGAGAYFLMNSSTGTADLPQDETTSTILNSWLEFRYIAAPSGDGHHPDLVGTDPHASRCDHRHHILSDRNPTTSDDITQGYPTTTLWTNTETGLSYILVDEDTGEWQAFATAGAHTHDAGDIIGGSESSGTTQHSHPDLSEEGLNTAAIGGWQWIQEPRAVAYRDRVYVGSVAGDSGDVSVTVFNSADPTTAPIEKVLHAALETDIHNNATSLVRDSDHKLLTLYCGHVLANIYTRLSTTSLDTDPDLDDGFAAEVNIDASLGSLSYTYPSIVQLADGTIFIFYREGNALDGDWYYHTSTDDGSTWSARTMIVTQAGESPYMKVVRNGDSRLDFVMMDEHPLDGDNSVLHFYYDGTFHTSDGTALTLPATHSNATLVYSGTPGIPAWIWDIAIGADDYPRIAYSVFDGGTDHTYYYATWDGSSWASEEVATAADGEIISGVPGGIALDRSDATIAYLIRQADSELELFRATRIGGVWTLDPITVGSAEQNQYPVALHNPYPETRTGNAIRAVYLTGTYTGEDVWDLDISLVTSGSTGSAGASALDDLTDVTISTPAEHDTLRYDGAEWVNDSRRWEPVTDNPGGGPELVWDGDDLVMEWKDY